MLGTEQSSYYEGRLPHIEFDGACYFITYVLKGALPRRQREAVRRAYEEELEAIRNRKLPPQEERSAIQQMGDQYFEKYERILSGDTGPHHLKDPFCAQTVLDSLHFIHHQQRWRLIAATVMSNHVHIIVDQVQGLLWEVLRDHKRYTSKLINHHLGLVGQQLWMYESWDRYTRNAKDFWIRIWYTLLNPVKANLVTNWWEYPFTYVAEQFDPRLPASI